jgi:hypothetical protein
MRIAHVALWTHDLDGRRNSDAEHSVLRPASRTTVGGVSVSQPCSDQAFPVALVPPLSRPFPPFGERSLSAQLRRPRQWSTMSAIRRRRQPSGGRK